MSIKIGVKIQLTSKDFILENDPNVVQNKLTQQIQQDVQQSQKTGKKKPAQTQITPDSLMSYTSLPFQISDIVEVYPVLKHLDI